MAGKVAQPACLVDAGLVLGGEAGFLLYTMTSNGRRMAMASPYDTQMTLFSETNSSAVDVTRRALE